MCGTPLSILPSSTSRVQGIGRLCKFKGWYKGFTNQQNSGLNQQHWITLVKETHGTFSWPLEWWVKIRTSGKMEELKKVFQDHTRIYIYIFNYLFIYISKWHMKLRTARTLATLFPNSQCSVSFTCYPQVCIGLVTVWHAHSLRPISSPVP